MSAGRLFDLPAHDGGSRIRQFTNEGGEKVTVEYDSAGEPVGMLAVAGDDWPQVEELLQGGPMTLPAVRQACEQLGVCFRLVSTC